MAARDKCREDFRDAEREEDNTLRIMVDGLVASLQDKLSQPIEKVDSGISCQIGLVTSYVRTHFIVTDLILNGDLVEAVTLIRKQLESVARLNELDQRPLHKLEGKTPNIRMFFEHGGGEMYGHLSEVAHFSKPRVSELMRHRPSTATSSAKTLCGGTAGSIPCPPTSSNSCSGGTARR